MADPAFLCTSQLWFNVSTQAEGSFSSAVILIVRYITRKLDGTCQIHQSPISISAADQRALQSSQSPGMLFQCLSIADEWMWQKKCLGKAIPWASQQFLLSFITSVRKQKGSNLMPLWHWDTQGDLTHLCLSFPRRIYSICKNLSAHRACLFGCLVKTCRFPDSTSTELTHPSHPLWDLTPCWRLKVLWMKMKCTLCQHCLCWKTDDFH